MSATLADIRSAKSFQALYGSAMIALAAAGAAAGAISAASVAAASGKGEEMAEAFENYYQSYSQSFKEDLKQFNSYVDDHGFASAWDKYNISYDNIGLAHAHLLENDLEYLNKTVEIDQKTKEITEASEKEMQEVFALADKYGISLDEERKEFAKLQTKLSEAVSKGDINAQRDIQLEMSRARTEMINAVRQQAPADLQDKQTLDTIQGNETERFADLWQARQDQFDEFMKSARKAGATEQQLGEYQKEYDARTKKLEMHIQETKEQKEKRDSLKLRNDFDATFYAKELTKLERGTKEQSISDSIQNPDSKLAAPINFEPSRISNPVLTSKVDIDSSATATGSLLGANLELASPEITSGSVLLDQKLNHEKASPSENLASLVNRDEFTVKLPHEDLDIEAKNAPKTATTTAALDIKGKSESPSVA